MSNGRRDAACIATRTFVRARGAFVRSGPRAGQRAVSASVGGLTGFTTTNLAGASRRNRRAAAPGWRPASPVTTEAGGADRPPALRSGEHAMTDYVVTAGETSSGITLDAGDTLTVDSGGTAINTLVSSGGVETVLSGGVDYLATVLPGGTLIVDSGGFEDYLTADTGADIEIADPVVDYEVTSGETLSGVTIDAINLTIDSGGTLINPDLFVGNLTIDSGGTLIDPVFPGILPGTILDGLLNIALSGSVVGTVLSVGEGLDFEGSGLVLDPVIDGGGIIADGAIVSGASVSGVVSGVSEHTGILDVEPGAIVLGGTVGYAGVIQADDPAGTGGGVVSGTVIASGGYITTPIVGGDDLDTVGVILRGGVFQATDHVVGHYNNTGTIVSSGGYLQAYNSGAVILAGGTDLVTGARAPGEDTGDQIVDAGATVSSGGLLLDQTFGGTIALYDGDGLFLRTFSSATPSGGDLGDLAGGAVAAGTIISNGGTEIVSGGGIAFEPSITSGGTIILGSDGILIAEGDNHDEDGIARGIGGIWQGAGGTLELLPGGFVLGDNLSAVYDESIRDLVRAASAGIVYSGFYPISGGILAIGAGDTWENNPNTRAYLNPSVPHTGLMALSGGIVIVSGGQTITGTVVSAGGEQQVLAGNSASATVVNGGTEIVQGRTSGTTVYSGGIEEVFGTASRTVVASGGTLELLLSGTAPGMALSAGAQLLFGAGAGLAVSNGQVSSGLAAVGGGVIAVSSGGSATGAVVSAGGSLTVWSGGAASGTQVSGGGETVSAGGTETGAMLAAGGSQGVAGFALDTTLDDNDVQTVSSGGSASGTVVSATDSQVVLSGGTSIATMVSSGGVEIVSSGGVASGTTLLSGGTLIVDSGGSDPGLHFSGGVVLNPGSPVVSNGQTSVGLVISAGNIVTVASGGVTTGATIGSGGLEVVSSGGTATATTLLSGGTLDLLGGASDPGLSDTGGRIEIDSGFVLAVAAATSSGLIVLSGGEADVSAGGVTTGTVISSGGLEIVSAGGIASATTMDSGGTLELLAGAAAPGLVYSGGTVEIHSGFVLGVTSAIAGDLVIQSGGELDISAGGVTYATTLLSGGTLDLLSGAFGPGLNDTGGTIEIGSGYVLGVIDATSRGLVVLSSGEVDINSGGVTTGTVVSSGGLEVVWSGGVASGTVASAGGSETVASGGTASDPTIGGGTLELQSGAIVSGAITFGGIGGTLQIDDPTAVTLPNTIGGFAFGDAIDLRGLAWDPSNTVSFNLGTLAVTGGGVTDTVALGGLVADSSFVLQSDGVGGTTVIDSTVTNEADLNTLIGSIDLGGTNAGADRSYAITIDGRLPLGGDLLPIDLPSGASLSVTGTNGSGGPGTIVEGGGSGFFVSAGHVSLGNLTIEGAGAGIGGGGLLELPTAANYSGGINFSGIGGTLQIDAPTAVALTNTIGGFAFGDTIDLRGLAWSPSNAVSYKLGTLTVTGGGVTDTLTLAGLAARSSFMLRSDGHGGTTVIDSTVTNEADLNTLIGSIDLTGTNAGADRSYAITIDGTLPLGGSLSAINLPSGASLTITGTDGGGGPGIVDGGGSERGFFVYAGNVTLDNLTIQHATASGGAGAAGGGGGAGLGGGLFVASGSQVTLDNVSFSADAAKGGAGGIGVAGGNSPSGRGGGGLGGGGGAGSTKAAGGGGGIGGRGGNVGGGMRPSRQCSRDGRLVPAAVLVVIFAATTGAGGGGAGGGLGAGSSQPRRDWRSRWVRRRWRRRCPAAVRRWWRRRVWRRRRRCRARWHWRARRVWRRRRRRPKRRQWRFWRGYRRRPPLWRRRSGRRRRWRGSAPAAISSCNRARRWSSRAARWVPGASVAAPAGRATTASPAPTPAPVRPMVPASSSKATRRSRSRRPPGRH